MLLQYERTGNRILWAWFWHWYWHNMNIYLNGCFTLCKKAFEATVHLRLEHNLVAHSFSFRRTYTYQLNVCLKSKRCNESSIWSRWYIMAEEAYPIDILTGKSYCLENLAQMKLISWTRNVKSTWYNCVDFVNTYVVKHSKYNPRLDIFSVIVYWDQIHNRLRIELASK